MKWIWKILCYFEWHRSSCGIKQNHYCTCDHCHTQGWMKGKGL